MKKKHTSTACAFRPRKTFAPIWSLSTNAINEFAGKNSVQKQRLVIVGTSLKEKWLFFFEYDAWYNLGSRCSKPGTAWPRWTKQGTRVLSAPNGKISKN
jgi:hypothetical protein